MASQPKKTEDGDLKAAFVIFPKIKMTIIIAPAFSGSKAQFLPEQISLLGKLGACSLAFWSMFQQSISQIDWRINSFPLSSHSASQAVDNSKRACDPNDENKNIFS